MPIRLSSVQQQDRVQSMLREQFKQPESESKNLEAVQNLGATSTLQYRGRLYTANPVGYKDGLRLQRLFMRLQRLGALEEEVTVPADAELKHLQEIEQLLTEMATEFRTLVVPVGWLHRITWRLTKTNPFFDATQRELGEMLGFFSACRMKSTVGFIAHSGAARQSSSISSMN